MPKKILIPVPSQDFDPTEAAVPWRILREAGHEIRFATPDGLPANADPRILTGERLGIFSPLLRAKREARETYEELLHSTDFLRPLSWSEVDTAQFDALVLPGGHAPGMKPYLESHTLQQKVAEFFQSGKPVAAICHGVVLAARSRSGGKSVLAGRRVTALPKWMELSAWLLTGIYLGRYYRTYAVTVEDEVRGALGKNGKFIRGPISNRTAFAVLDAPESGASQLVTSRWPGDARRFASELLKLL